jgi:hypothetical protein
MMGEASREMELVPAYPGFSIRVPRIILRRFEELTGTGRIR